MSATGTASLKEKMMATYDPRNRWSSAAQPFPGLIVEDYINIAKDAAPSLAQSARTFCEQNKFSFVEIPHEVFAATYEKQDTPIAFRKWVEKYCSLKGMASVPQIAIIGPRVKTLESAERKTILKDPSHNPDYLGIMLVVLKGNGDHTGLNRLAKAMQAMERDQKTEAVKDYFFKPHNETGFRGHKNVWIETGAPGTELHGFGILAEVKLQHEDHMDVDNLTRNRIVGLNRQYQRWLINLHTSFGGAAKQAALHSQHAEESRKYITKLGLEIYNLVFANSGLNRFLDPGLATKYAPMEADDIRKMILEEGRKFYAPRHLQDLLAAVENSGVLPATSAATAKSSSHRSSIRHRELELSLAT